MSHKTRRSEARGVLRAISVDSRCSVVASCGTGYQTLGIEPLHQRNSLHQPQKLLLEGLNLHLLGLLLLCSELQRLLRRDGSAEYFRRGYTEPMDSCAVPQQAVA